MKVIIPHVLISGLALVFPAMGLRCIRCNGDSDKGVNETTLENCVKTRRENQVCPPLPGYESLCMIEVFEVYHKTSNKTVTMVIQECAIEPFCKISFPGMCYHHNNSLPADLEIRGGCDNRKCCHRDNCNTYPPITPQPPTTGMTSQLTATKTELTSQPISMATVKSYSPGAHILSRILLVVSLAAASRVNFQSWI